MIDGLGKVRVGCEDAATIRTWTVIPQAAGIGVVQSDIVAEIASANRYWATQKPTEIYLWLGKCWWVWPVESVDEQFFAGSTVTFRVFGNPVVKF